MGGTETPEFFTLEQVAEMIGCGLEALKADVRAGRVRHVHRGRSRRMTWDQIQELAAASTEGTTDPVAIRAALRPAGTPRSEQEAQALDQRRVRRRTARRAA